MSINKFLLFVFLIFMPLFTSKSPKFFNINEPDYKENSFYDLKNETVMKEIFKKIKHYESIERAPVHHLNPNDLDEKIKSSNKLRSMEESNIFNDITLIDLKYYFIYQTGVWFYRSFSNPKEKMIVYPYAFDYKYNNSNNETINKHYHQGAFLSFKQPLDALKSLSLTTNGTFKAKKARTIMGGDIAILSVEAVISHYNQDLFHDSIDYCNFFWKNLLINQCFANFDYFYQEKMKNPMKKYLTRLNETDIKNGKLLFEGIPRFGVLVIPDYKLGTDELIKEKLGKDGMDNILKFYNSGGKIIVTGKSGVLFEDIGIIEKGTYNRKQLLNSESSDRKIKIKGCEEVYDKEYDENIDNDNFNFNKHLICIHLIQNSKASLSSTFKTAKKDNNFKTLIEIDSEDENLVYVDTESGLSYSLTEEEKEYNPLIMYKSNDKNGDIFVLNFNPLYKGADYSFFFNTLFLILSKELYLISKVNINNNSNLEEELPIPAGETGVELEIESTFHNLDDKKLKDFTLYFFLADNFDWKNSQPKCKRKNNFSLLPNNIKNKKILESKTDYLECNLGEIDSYYKTNFNLKISILNYLATQQKDQVLLIQAFASFYNSENKQSTITDNIIINCEPAPVVTVEINPEPQGFYPIWGRGVYVDNIAKLENKEESNAYNISLTEIIPLITPYVDTLDQRKIAYTIKLFSDYYNNHNFEVPLSTPGSEDIIYTAELQEKSALIGMEWNSPVLQTKELYLDGEIGKPVTVKGINIGKITVTSTSEIIKQINYRNADRLYKLATYRLMPYLDDTTKEGAKTLYGSNIPNDLKDPIFGDRAKKDLIFLRNDIFFYNNSNFCNPPGVNDKIILSIDKLVPYQKNKNNCSKEIGEARSQKIKKGYFTNNSTNSEIKNKILEATIYSNELFEYCDIDVINPLDEDELYNYFKSNEYFKPVHYIFDNIDNNLTNPKQLYNFISVNDRYGYHKDYNSIKFIYLHSMEFILINTTCLYGGRFIINLGEFDLKSINDITISPNHIAVYNITYENHEIIIYFKRGLMSNEQFGKNMKQIIYIENLPKIENISLNMVIEELKYDISYPPNYERYYFISNQSYNFIYKSAFSFPALEIKSNLNRTLNKYEIIEPFSQYGVYTQEINHRTVYSSGETHHEYDQGIVTEGACSYITNLGSSSLPYIEYLRTGITIIPGSMTTSRIFWKDIWGRNWYQPLRSLFPDVLPVPPIDKNFAMTSTYEILNKGKQILEWPSDENVQIHIHNKLLNNYYKYFEITKCKNNELRYIPKIISHDDVLINLRHIENVADIEIKENEYYNNSDKMYIQNGGYSKYGVCYSNENAIVNGKKITGDNLEYVKKAVLCEDEIDPEKIVKCEEELKNIPQISKCPEDWDQNKLWNYSPLVEDFYPAGYIDYDMWNMNIYDYDDTSCDKAYLYHIDNHVPSYDNSVIYPENIINVPIYKGLGYKIIYNKTNSMKYHNEIKEGWWSDNLQNKDDTLIAQNEVSNKISIDKKSTLEWIEGKELIGSKREGTTELVKELINNRTKNIYVCLFNRKRVKYNINSKKHYQSVNVVENNVVPILVDLNKGDSRLFNYNCKEEQFEPDNIHNLDGNLLVTPTSKDYLYFAANLRAGAKESLHVLMNLNFYNKVKYEGIIKINEGSRFVYFNPSLGLNSYKYSDSPASFVNAKRNDIEILGNVFPQTIPTFNGIIYHSFIIKDENKINKVWPYSNYYYNSYGFGDVSVSVSVGGIEKTKPILKPGKTTYAKIVFYNNCGFDWKMNIDAIDFKYMGSKPINSFELFHRFIHHIQLPLEYRFFKYIIEDKYKPYIKITPSDHNYDISGEYFDLESINVVTIRDGYKGEYYLKISVSNDFPNNFRGKPIEIKIELNTTYFEHFPGTETDPIKTYHNYKVEIPSLFIAIPYNDGEFNGKVLYTSAYASDLTFQINQDIEFKIEGIKFISKDFLSKMINLTTNDTNPITELNKFWDTLKNQKSIETTDTEVRKDIKIITISGIKEELPLFPKRNEDKPDDAEIIILLKASYTQYRPGYGAPIYYPRMTYKDWSGKKKTYNPFSSSYLNCRGAWIDLSYSRKLVDKVSDHLFSDRPDQNLYPDEEGFMQVQFKMQNTGNGISYKTKFKIIIQPGLKYEDHRKGITKLNEEKLENGQTILTFNLNNEILPGEIRGGIIYLHYSKIIDSYDISNIDEINNLPKELNITEGSSAIFDITEEGDNQVTEKLKKSLVFQYQLKKESLKVYIHLKVSGRRSNPTVKIIPKIKYTSNISEKDSEIIIYKDDITNYNENNRLRNLEEEEIELNSETLKTDKDKPCIKDNSNKEHEVIYSVFVISKDKDNTFGYKRITFKQKEIGLSTSEKILISISVIFYIIAALFVFLSIKNIKIHLFNNKLENNLEKLDKEQLLNEE